MIKQAIQMVVNGEHLSGAMMLGVMNQIMEGEATPAQIAAFITALRLKGETVEEIAACASVMREKATPITADLPKVLDTCGTGGDETGTFNISTAAALIAAGAGVKVAKHGNRSVSSKCGSADVLAALGVKVDAAPEVARRCLDEAGICFLFAPVFHKAMKFAIGPRREIGIRTVFNILGPLSNPARTQYQLLGVFNPALTITMANVLRELGARRVMIVHGEGLDEITTTGQTTVAELKDGKVASYTLSPEDFGIQQSSIQNLKGGDDAENARIILEILRGGSGPKVDIAILNAGAAIYVAEEAGSIAEGIQKAKASINSGAALDVLEKLKEMSNLQ